MTVVDLDGTPSGSITFEKLNSVVGGTALSINFIPNLNPKAKYMLLAATIEIVSVVIVMLVRLFIIADF